MNQASRKTLLFQHAPFVTHLPIDYSYTPSHLWAERRQEGRLRFGFTRFATRLLGEMVDHKFETDIGTAVHVGQVLGWVEAFKALSDVLCAGEGVFAGGNPALNESIGLINESTYSEGWLYEVDGRLGEPTLDVYGYAEHLKSTIDRLRQARKADEQQRGDR
jgi:glycine cleavage system H protein